MTSDSFYEAESCVLKLHVDWLKNARKSSNMVAGDSLENQHMAKTNCVCKEEQRSKFGTNQQGYDGHSLCRGLMNSAD